MRGYNFGGKKAELMLQRLRQLKRDPEARRRLVGLKPERKGCPYCGKDRRPQDCIDQNMARQVLPACAVGPRSDAPDAEKRRFRDWIAGQ